MIPSQPDELVAACYSWIGTRPVGRGYFPVVTSDDLAAFVRERIAQAVEESDRYMLKCQQDERDGWVMKLGREVAQARMEIQDIVIDAIDSVTDKNEGWVRPSEYKAAIKRQFAEHARKC